MTPLFYETVHRVSRSFSCVVHWLIVPQLQTAVAKQVGNGNTEVDVLGWMSRTALELIGQGGLGYSFDPLVSDTRNDYGEALKDLV